MSVYISDVAGDRSPRCTSAKDTAIVLYCNGPYCGKSKRLAAELVAGGYTKGPALPTGHPGCGGRWGASRRSSLKDCATFSPNDHTAVVVDVREAQEREATPFPNAQPIPRSAVLEGKDCGEIKRAKDDGRLPMEDHNRASCG